LHIRRAIRQGLAGRQRAGKRHLRLLESNGCLHKYDHVDHLGQVIQKQLAQRLAVAPTQTIASTPAADAPSSSAPAPPVPEKPKPQPAPAAAKAPAVRGPESLDDADLEPGGKLEATLDLKTFSPDRKLTLRLEVSAGDGKTDVSGKFEVDPLL
jgi:hypothetical protein